MRVGDMRCSQLPHQSVVEKWEMEMGLYVYQLLYMAFGLHSQPVYTVGTRGYDGDIISILPEQNKLAHFYSRGASWNRQWMVIIREVQNWMKSELIRLILIQNPDPEPLP